MTGKDFYHSPDLGANQMRDYPNTVVNEARR